MEAGLFFFQFEDVIIFSRHSKRLQMQGAPQDGAGGGPSLYLSSKGGEYSLPSPFGRRIG
jgi:hypothetical protein